ncbi:MAG: response regulator [Desulfuromonadaceae bacterium]|nr:response regulator [Desulfuromonadaceae bacterium]
MKQTQKTLIVEDSELQATFLEAILKELGIGDVTRAVNGIDGLEYFERALQEGVPYSLLFIDIVMPEMDGQELLKRIRSHEKNAGISATGKSVIIMTTALNTPEDMIEAIINGDCNDYIVKPVIQSNLDFMLRKYKLIG